LARTAVHLGKDDAVSLSRAGHALAFVVHELDAAAFLIDRKRPAIRAFRIRLTHEIVCPLIGKLSGTHDERYGAFQS